MRKHYPVTSKMFTMLRLQCICSILWLASLAVASAASEVQLAAALDKTSVPLNQTCTLTIDLKWQADAAAYKFETPRLVAGEQFTIKSSAASTSSWDENGTHFAAQRFQFVLQPLRQSVIGIPSVTVRYRANADDATPLELTTPPLELTVTAPVVSKSFPIPWWLLPTGAVALLGGSMAALLLRRRARLRRRLAEPVPLSPLEEAKLRVRDLEKMRSIGEIREYALELGKVMYDSLRTSFGLSGALDFPSMLSAAPQGIIPEELKTELLISFELIDRVKYAGHQPGSSELDRLAETARRLLNQLVVKKGDGK